MSASHAEINLDVTRSEVENKSDAPLLETSSQHILTILKYAYYRGCRMPTLHSGNQIEATLSNMQLEELKELRNIVKSDAWKFYWQKLFCYGTSALTITYAFVSIFACYFIPDKADADKVTLSGDFGGVILGCSSFSIGLTRPSRRENIANSVIERIDAEIENRPKP